MTPSMTRSAVCRLLGISEKTLYLWERDGRAPLPRRDRRNWRRYSSKHVAALRRLMLLPAARSGSPSSRRSPGSARVGSPPARSRRGSADTGSPPGIDGLSARNQLRGTVVALRRVGLLCEVTLRLGDGQEVTAIITDSSAVRLDLGEGVSASALIKATEVMILRGGR